MVIYKMCYNYIVLYLFELFGCWFPRLKQENLFYKQNSKTPDFIDQHTLNNIYNKPKLHEITITMPDLFNTDLYIDEKHTNTIYKQNSNQNELNSYINKLHTHILNSA